MTAPWSGAFPDRGASGSRGRPLGPPRPVTAALIRNRPCDTIENMTRKGEFTSGGRRGGTVYQTPASDLDKEIGRILSADLKNRRIWIREAAEQLGVSYGYLYNRLRGFGSWTIVNLAKIALILGYDSVETIVKAAQRALDEQKRLKNNTDKDRKQSKTD